MELRCSSKLHGIMVGEDVLEVSCNSRFCGYRKGVAIRHRISIRTGELLETLKFSELPIKES